MRLLLVEQLIRLCHRSVQMLIHNGLRHPDILGTDAFDQLLMHRSGFLNAVFALLRFLAEQLHLIAALPVEFYQMPIARQRNHALMHLRVRLGKGAAL